LFEPLQILVLFEELAQLVFSAHIFGGRSVLVLNERFDGRGLLLGLVMNDGSGKFSSEAKLVPFDVRLDDGRGRHLGVGRHRVVLWLHRHLRRRDDKVLR
jgi:hypothetical protein